MCGRNGSVIFGSLARADRFDDTRVEIALARTWIAPRAEIKPFASLPTHSGRSAQTGRPQAECSVDRSLVLAARSGDEEAFASLARGSADRLFAVAHRILRDVDRAEDAVQQTLVTAWRELPGLREAERFDAWLHLHPRRRLLRGSAAGATLDGQRPGPARRRTDQPRHDPGRRRSRHPRPRLPAPAAGAAGDLRPPPLPRPGRSVRSPTRSTSRSGTVKSRLHYATNTLRAALEADARTVPSILAGAHGMNGNTDFDRIAQSWLADGPTEMPDRSLQAALDEVHVTSQQRFGAARRVIPMNGNTWRVAAAAVIGLLIILGGSTFLGGRQGGVGGPPAASPTTTASGLRRRPSSQQANPWSSRPVRLREPWAKSSVLVYGAIRLDRKRNDRREGNWRLGPRAVSLEPALRPPVHAPVHLPHARPACSWNRSRRAPRCHRRSAGIDAGPDHERERRRLRLQGRRLHRYYRPCHVREQGRTASGSGAGALRP